jgi:hypothetical protein
MDLDDYHDNDCFPPAEDNEEMELAVEEDVGQIYQSSMTGVGDRTIM